MVQRLLGIGFVVLSFITCMPAASVQATGHPYDEEITQIINQERQRAGLPPLLSVATLGTSALQHNQWMHAQQCFSHQCAGEPTLLDRSFPDDETQGYRVGEVLAFNHPTPGAAVAAWLDSAEHRGVVLSANFTEIGCSYVTGEWAALWTCDFGTPVASLAATPLDPDPEPPEIGAEPLLPDLGS